MRSLLFFIFALTLLLQSSFAHRLVERKLPKSPQKKKLEGVELHGYECPLRFYSFAQLYKSARVATEIQMQTEKSKARRSRTHKINPYLSPYSGPLDFQTAEKLITWPLPAEGVDAMNKGSPSLHHVVLSEDFSLVIGVIYTPQSKVQEKCFRKMYPVLKSLATKPDEGFRCGRDLYTTSDLIAIAYEARMKILTSINKDKAKFLVEYRGHRVDGSYNDIKMCPVTPTNKIYLRGSNFIVLNAEYQVVDAMVRHGEDYVECTLVSQTLKFEPKMLINDNTDLDTLNIVLFDCVGTLYEPQKLLEAAEKAFIHRLHANQIYAPIAVNQLLGIKLSSQLSLAAMTENLNPWKFHRGGYFSADFAVLDHSYNVVSVVHHQNGKYEVCSKKILPVTDFYSTGLLDEGQAE